MYIKHPHDIHTTKQSGFSTIVVIVGIVLIAGLALAGWVVWHTSQSNSANKANTNTTQGAPKASKETPEQPVDPSEGGKYLVIKEWGIKIPLQNEYRNDVEYGLYTRSDNSQTIYFASKKIAAKSENGQCGLIESNDSTDGYGLTGGTIAVTRYDSKPLDDQQRIFQYAQYWYALDFSNGGACYQGDTGEETGRFKAAMDIAIRQLQSE
jgi:hypothetical protein